MFKIVITILMFIISPYEHCKYLYISMILLKYLKNLKKKDKKN